MADTGTPPPAQAMTYQVWTNLDSGSMRPYQPGDRLVAGWTDEIPGDNSGERLEAVAEWVFIRHNADERPDGQLAPSLSVGDVVTITGGPAGEGAALSVDAVGFVPVTLDPNGLIRDRTWREALVDAVAVPPPTPGLEIEP